MDTLFFVGIIVFLLMIPRCLAAMADGRSPRYALFIMLCGAVMVAVPVARDPGHYKPSTFANMVITKIGNMLNN